MTGQDESKQPQAMRAVWCGRVNFGLALAAQDKLREALIAGDGQPTLLLCEHPPSLTMGRRAQPEHLLWNEDQRTAQGLQVFETPRGGEATLHAPGQLVVYPVCYVGKRIRAHIQHLADAAIEVLRHAGIEGAEMDWEHPGVWRAGHKLGSIGVHVSRGVAIQGMSLNVAVDPSLFGALVSCGMPQVSMASWWSLRDTSRAQADWAREDRDAPPMEAIARSFAHAFAERAGYALQWSDAATLPALRDDVHERVPS